MSELIERLQNEADLCRNDGADDIAKLLDEAVEEIERLQGAVDAAHGSMAVISNYRNNTVSVFEMMSIAKGWLNEFVREEQK